MLRGSEIRLASLQMSKIQFHEPNLSRIALSAWFVRKPFMWGPVPTNPVNRALTVIRESGVPFLSCSALCAERNTALGLPVAPTVTLIWFRSFLKRQRSILRN